MYLVTFLDVRADRLVSLVLLLRRNGRMTAAALARELEVSTRTVLRDIEALSAAGVPVYAERGRHGGFALLPGFRAELAGLSQDEALALLVAGSRRGARALGLGPALASAMLKVVDALPERYGASAAAGRLLVDPETDLLERPLGGDEVPGAVAAVVLRAVFGGRRLRILYAAAGQEPRWRTVDPVGVVTVRERAYVLATREGEDRTYRLSRIVQAQELPEAARRPERVDLGRVWRERGARFRGGGDQVRVEVVVDAGRRADLAGTALAVLAERPLQDGRVWLEVMFQDRRHAEWALWEFASAAEALAPGWLRERLHARAAAIAARYAPP